jgi:RNase P subunit RPR2
MDPALKNEAAAAERTARIRVPPSTDRAQAPADPYEKTVLLRDAAPAGRPAAPPAADGGDGLFQHYAILGKIGDGGMGVVYLARDKRLGRFVAVKRLNAQAQSVQPLRQRFLQEARAAAALTHIHIVHVYELGEDQDGPYIVMEYIAGPDDPRAARPAGGADRPSPPFTLDQLVARQGCLALAEAADLLVKIGRAVAYAHANGVIHRDLKPSNVLLDKSGEPKIVDFGLARLRRGDDFKLTVPGEKLLSLGYGAPEQEQDASLSDERADVYGLGALLYFAITGQNPRYFREPDIPVPLRDVLVKALATDREQRYASAAAFTEALQAIQSRTRVEVPPTVKTTWRCKWCDAVNPLTLRFCADCGWDGGAACPECGADTFVGVQFCGACGADARAYEAVLHALERARAALAQRQYDRALSLAGRLHGFEAAGPSGRRLQKEAQELRERAERSLARRDELREQIPVELRAENYERALAFIRESRGLDGDPRAYEDEERRIPELVLARDLGRARRAARQRDWATAGRLCEELRRHAPADHPDVLRLRRAIAAHHGLGRAAWAGAGAAGALLLYLLLLPVFARGSRTPFDRPWRGLWRPAWRCYAAGPLAGPLAAWNALWGRPDLAARFGAAGPEAPVQPGVVSADQQKLQDGYSQQLQEIAAEQRRFDAVWPQDYLRELNALADRRQAAGDYDGLVVTRAETKQFVDTRQIGSAPPGDFAELTQAMQKYRGLLAAHRLDRCRRLINATKKYVNDLTDLQRTLTREGRMNLAAAANAEIRRVQGSADVQDAEAALAAATETGPAKPPPAGVLPSAGPGQLAELAPLRTRYQEQLDGTASDFTRKMDEWPDKYLAALKALMEQVRQQGIYDEWDAVKTELDRFEADRQIQPKDVAAQPARLGQLQKQHLDLLAQYRRARASGVVKAADEFVARLEELQKKLTRDGNMEMAAAVNAQIRQVRGSAEYLAAKQELAPPPPPEPPAAAATNRPPA